MQVVIITPVVYFHAQQCVSYLCNHSLVILTCTIAWKRLEAAWPAATSHGWSHSHDVHRHSCYSSAAVLQINISCLLSFFSRLSKLFTADTYDLSVTLGILTLQNPSGDVYKVESGSMKLCKEKCLKGWNYRNRFLWSCSFKAHILAFKNMWLHWVRLILKHWADSQICSQALHGKQICLLIT